MVDPTAEPNPISETKPLALPLQIRFSIAGADNYGFKPALDQAQGLEQQIDTFAVNQLTDIENLRLGGRCTGLKRSKPRQRREDFYLGFRKTVL